MKTRNKKFGFTIVELLTVMAVIALLLGILAPALNRVRRIAKDTRQRSQFHSIDIAMEAYAGEIGEYPDSLIRPWNSATSTPSGSGPFTVGAHHLAEALLGRDLLGLDPWTSWDAEADKTRSIYGRTTAADANASLDRRKGPYLNPESAEAFQIQQLYGTSTRVYDGNDASAPVLTDSYPIKVVSLPGTKQVKAGSPILYYKANTLSKEFYNSNNFTQTIADATTAVSIFNSQDNEELLALGRITDGTFHHFDTAYVIGAMTGRELFYDAITNPKITSQVRPYNQSSYILMSAGYDGIFGTPDDIYNFSQ